MMNAKAVRERAALWKIAANHESFKKRPAGDKSLLDSRLALWLWRKTKPELQRICGPHVGLSLFPGDYPVRYQVSCGMRKYVGEVGTLATAPKRLPLEIWLQMMGESK